MEYREIKGKYTTKANTLKDCKVAYAAFKTYIAYLENKYKNPNQKIQEIIVRADFMKGYYEHIVNKLKGEQE